MSIFTSHRRYLFTCKIHCKASDVSVNSDWLWQRRSMIKYILKHNKQSMYLSETKCCTIIIYIIHIGRVGKLENSNVAQSLPAAVRTVFRAGMGLNLVFPKGFSRNSVNSSNISKNGMVTRNNTQLVTCTLPVVLIKFTFPSLALVRYLLPFTPVNSYLTRYSWEHLVFATTSGNVSVISCGVSLVTTPHLDLLVFSEFSKSHFGKFKWTSSYVKVLPLKYPTHTPILSLLN